ncbi:MAG TPA: ribonuclease HI family protein [Candidatus Bathyarchaeia archaeon]|nr:ribonuclease HI family protein [Candidatus Bathyarchaeia archaeon]
MPILYIDAETLGNEQRKMPRSARIAVALSESSMSVNPNMLKIYWRHIGDWTNNQAEYHALLKALELVADRWAEKSNGRIPSSVGQVLIRSDSKLVVNQVGGEWKVEEPGLIELNHKAKDAIRKLGSIRLEWVPREQNYAGLWLEGNLRPSTVERVNA